MRAFPQMPGLTIRHDALSYPLRNVPEAKFRNYRLMQQSRPGCSSDHTAPGMPWYLQIEVTSICNLRCHLCPVGEGLLNRPSRHMTAAEFSSIVDDMETWLLFLVLWDWGEPFTNPEFPAMIRYAAERDIATVTSTNGHFLQEGEYVAEILDSGLSTLIVALDSLDRDTYRRFRRRGDLERILTGIENLIRLRNRLGSPTRINLRMVVTRDNEHEIGRLRRYARQAGADCFTVKTVNPDCGPDSFDSEIIPADPALQRFAYEPGTRRRIRLPAAACSTLWQTCSIHSNGVVVPCYNDYDAEFPLGNVFDIPLSELWNAEVYREFRRTHLASGAGTGKCRNCWIHFERSANGRFISRHHYYRSLPIRYREAGRRLARSFPPLQVLKKVLRH